MKYVFASSVGWMKVLFTRCCRRCPSALQYLANFELHMRKQMRDILEVAKGTSENWEVEKPRYRFSLVNALIRILEAVPRSLIAGAL